MEELEIMRSQLTTMRRQLDTQKIVTETLMRQIMQNKASWLNRLVTLETASLPIIFLILALICHFERISQWYAIAFLIMAAVDIYFDRRTIRIPARLFSSTILDLKKYLVRQKKERFIQICISIPLTFIWLISFFVAIASVTATGPSGETISYVNAGGLIGGIIGAILSAIIIPILYKKIQRTNEAILKNISDLENDE